MRRGNLCARVKTICPVDRSNGLDTGMRRSHDPAADLELSLAGAPGGVKRKAHAWVYGAPGQIPPMDPCEADASAEGPLRCGFLSGAGGRCVRNAGREVRGKRAAHAEVAAPGEPQAIGKR